MDTAIGDFKPFFVEQMLEIYQSHEHCFEDIGVCLEFLLECSQRPDFLIKQAYMGEKLLGYAGCLFFENVGRAELGPIVVRGDMLGQGIGKALYYEMEQALRKRGIRRFIVKVKDGNMQALGFFKGLGFSVEAVLRDYTLQGEDIVQLVAYIK